MNRDFFDGLKLGDTEIKLKYLGGALMTRMLNTLLKPTYTDNILKIRRELGGVKFPKNFWE